MKQTVLARLKEKVLFSLWFYLLFLPRIKLKCSPEGNRPGGPVSTQTLVFKSCLNLKNSLFLKIIVGIRVKFLALVGGWARPKFFFTHVTNWMIQAFLDVQWAMSQETHNNLKIPCQKNVFNVIKISSVTA